MENKSKKFNVRSFVALMIALTGLGLPVTGIANHVYGFDSLTLERHAWMSAHNGLALLFSIFSIWHVVLNRRALWNHIRCAAPQLSGNGREALAAVATVALAMLLFVGHAFALGGGR